MAFVTLLTFIIVIALLSVGLIVILKDSRQLLNRLFFVFVVTASAWIVANYYGNNLTISHETALIANHLTLFIPGVTLIVLLNFCLAAARQPLFSKRWLTFSLFSFVVFATSLTPLVVKNIYPQGEVYAIEYGVLTIPYMLVLVTTTILIFKVLVGGIRHASDKQEKKRLQVIFWGIVAMLAISIVTNALLPVFGSSVYSNFGPLSTLVLIYALWYSIIRHRLFDIRLVVARSLGYILSLGFITGVFSLLIFGFSGAVIDSHFSRFAKQLFYVSVTLALVLFYPYLKRFFDRITNKIFYRDAYDSQQLLSFLNQVLVSTIELKTLLEEASDAMIADIKSEFCFFLIDGKDGRDSRLIGSTVSTHKIEASDVNKLNELLKGNSSKPIETDTLNQDDPLKRLLRQRNIGICSHLVSSKGHQSESIGFLLLGDKRSGNPYNSQDIRTIGIIANEMVIAMQNALRFEEIQQFNITLQGKIDVATHKLRQSNEKLRALDETKDEFISMASHQLRTPLTSVKGYLSMVIEGDAGKINDMQKKLLDQAFISSQRMVYLIADLLNVSRLRTGKFIIERAPTQLADVIETEIAQLTETAKGRGLELTYDKPKDFPVLMLDETKIRQVIMNFADNAIYYTQSGPNRGHIHIALEDKGASVEFTVTDDGIGVPKEAQHHLFTKFYRASNAQHARPDGTGLGLFMAKKVIVAQDGAIIFHSEEGKGSTFGFSFPKARHIAPEHIAPSHQKTAAVK